MSYYDLDDILSETRLIPCTFNVDAYGLGDLDLSRDTDQKDLPKRTKVELPLWMVSILAPRNYVAVDLPPFFRRNAQMELLAGATRVDLYGKSPYFYEIGLKLAVTLYRTFPQITKDIVTTMRNTLENRLTQGIVTRGTIQGRDSSTLAFYDTLAELERRLFTCKEMGLKEIIAWKRGELNVIIASPLIVYAREAARKRKVPT